MVPPGTPEIDVVVPVHDEARVLETNLRRLHDHLTEVLDVPWTLTIAENASTDATPALARALAESLPGVRVRELAEAGRGRALRDAWLASEASVLAYMDADLSTDLADLVPLLDAVRAGRADLAIGSRLVPGASITRSFGRERISRTYNWLVRGLFRVPFHDAQCGFKAISADAARALLPQVEDDGWFFDTELLILALRAGLRIEEVPVHWVEDPDSSVRIVHTAAADLRGLARMARRGR